MDRASVTMPRLIPGKRRPLIVAHRGASAVCPENTPAAFRRALADGADFLETDLHLTRDGAFVCLHDATVDRTTDGHGAVAGMTLSELKKLSAGYGRPGFETERVPALAELAALAPPDIGLFLELKTDRFLEPGVCRRFAGEMDSLGLRKRAFVISFSLDRVWSVRAAAPDIPGGFITTRNLLPFRDARLFVTAWPLLLLNPFYSLAAHARGRFVAALDPGTGSRLRLCRLLACDAVVTDDPAGAIAALRL